MITEPGVYPDIDDAAYHADPVAGGSLSSTGARALLPPSCPARFRHDQDHGRATAGHYDFGHAAHRLVLGVGQPIEVIYAADWRTKAAKEARDAAHAAGDTPMLEAHHDVVQAMAAALRAHPAAALLHPDTGAAEQTLVWRDADTDVMCRARLDWLPNPTGSGRTIIPDYKTCASAELEALSRSMHQFGYHQQAAWYLDGVNALGLGRDPAFVFIAQEKTAPYIVTVFEPDHVALRIGQHRNHQARLIYRDCTATGRWPAYWDDIALLPLPAWAEIREGARS